MHRISAGLLLLFVSAAGLEAAPGKVTLLTGQNDGLIDRPAIQAAIDAAPKNGTVRLQGVFQLDGVEIFIRRSDVTVEGVVVDNDGDHRTNEDWADGQDNDGDGAIDEDDWDAELRGVLDGFGNPDQGSFPADPGVPGRSLFNRGFAVVAEDGVIVRDLKFTGMTRGVAFGGEVEVEPGLYCDDMVTTGAVVKNATAERNLFDNMMRGVQVFGASKGVRFRDNMILNEGGSAPILLVGDAIGCWEYDETPRPAGYPVGRPEGTQVTGNYVAHRSRFVVQIISADSTLFRDNLVEDVGAPLYVSNSPKTQVIGNALLAPSFGVGLWVEDAAPLSSAGTVIRDNIVESLGNGWEAITIIGNSTGIKASNNTIPNTDVSYYLAPGTHHNTVVLLQGQTAYDDGTDNKVIGGGG